ncbi:MULTISPECIES: histidine phosphatase family protein [unclassified Micromonospora]|uniref:histidine phosphatase family protein n=1 Tax=Micromonospora TaxID=1873 RepID=UPI00098D1D42|nr:MULTISPECIES: histidine phosphatase family protein [unclassified Micromonospora]MDI5940014.1 histidine phosphatase family protein [Micromonospora sp. DH15]OON27190.1 histidine phosphatase family protein [Micromonospora sp. Rc5]
MGEIVLVRHGETEWSASRRHTSYTDLELTDDGEREARGLAALLAGRRFALVLASPRRRALRTAELAGLAVTAVDEDLAEWNYGRYEGVTTADIHTTRPGWNIWTDGCPAGESPAEVGARLDRVLARAAAALADGDVALVGHAHSLRVLGARWIGLPPWGGGLLRLDTATVSTLGHEHGRPVILRWNQPPPPPPGTAPGPTARR